MNEATRTRTVLTEIRKRFPSAFVWKVNDAITGGIPDAVVVLHGHTYWIEFKVEKPRTPIVKLLTELQQLKIRSLLAAGATVVVAGLLPDGEMRVYEPVVREGQFVCDECPQPSLRVYLERQCTDPTHSIAAAPDPTAAA